MMTDEESVIQRHMYTYAIHASLEACFAGVMVSVCYAVQLRACTAQ